MASDNQFTSKTARKASLKSPWRKWYISPASMARARKTVEEQGGYWEKDDEKHK